MQLLPEGSLPERGRRFRRPTASRRPARRGGARLGFWQDSRRWDGPKVPAAEFWPAFRERFPLVVGYLGELVGIPDWDNGLAGHFSCLVDPSPGRPQPAATLTQENDLLLLQLDMIWHFTDMGLLERYCQAVLGAIGVGSISDEQLAEGDSDLEGWAAEPAGDPFDAIWV